MKNVDFCNIFSYVKLKQVIHHDGVGVGVVVSLLPTKQVISI